MSQLHSNYTNIPTTSLNTQRDLYSSEVCITEQTVSRIVADLIAGGQKPIQAKLEAPYIFNTKKTI